MKLDDLQVGDEVILGIYKGIVVEKYSDSVEVQFNNWSTINPWTNSLPRIVFKYVGLLDKVSNE
jgi:sortase (surface protein transpeptidase)